MICEDGGWGPGEEAGGEARLHLPGPVGFNALHCPPDRVHLTNGTHSSPFCNRGRGAEGDELALSVTVVFTHAATL